MIDPFLCCFTTLYGPLQLLASVVSIDPGRISVAQSPLQ